MIHHKDEAQFQIDKRAKEHGFEVKGRSWLEILWMDLRYSVRMLLKNRGFTVVSVIILALGIGANTVIFSVVNAVLFRPLPYEDPDRLVVIWSTHPQAGREVSSLPDFADWQDQGQSFEQLTATCGRSFSLTNGEEPERLTGSYVAPNLFTTLRIRPIHGRGFLPEDGRRGAPLVAVLSYGLWQRSFGSTPDIVGRSITLNGLNYTVVGIMPPRFGLPDGSEIWVPLMMDPAGLHRRIDYLYVMARLKLGVSLAQARAEMNSITMRLEQQYPQTNSGWRADVVPLHEQIVGDIRAALLVLMATVGIVLLIACANITNLLLSRATVREREIAIRAAVGAGRGQIMRQLLTESIILALLGGVVGALLALLGTDVIVRLGQRDIPRLSEISVDGRILGFTALLSLATGVFFGLAPALQFSRLNPNEALKSGYRAGGASGGARLRRVLVVAEVALSLILLVGAGLMIKSLHRLMNRDAGFNRENLLTLQITLPQTKYGESRLVEPFYQQLIENVRGLPGVVSITAVDNLPLSGPRGATAFNIAGRPAPAPEVLVDANVQNVGDRYIETMGIPLVLGRTLNEQDRDGPKSVLINQTLARQYFRDQDPIGQQIALGLPHTLVTPWMTIVGVVADVKHEATETESYPTMYVPYTWPSMTLVARTQGNPLGLVSAVRSEIRRLDRAPLIYNIRTMDQVLGEALNQRRFTMRLLSIFAAVALTLAAVGLYGVVSYAISQRMNEIGIRMALGAQQGDVLRLVVGEGLRLALAGTLIGLGGALALMRLMKPLLFDVSVTDPLTFSLVALLLVLVTLIACWIPAQRATKVDPMIVLRCE